MIEVQDKYQTLILIDCVKEAIITDPVPVNRFKPAFQPLNIRTIVGILP